MNIDALCAAVWEAERWMKQFNRKEYPGAFRRYGEKFESCIVHHLNPLEPQGSEGFFLFFFPWFPLFFPLLVMEINLRKLL